MTPEDDGILRREDGSIDLAPYLRRARDLRNSRLRRSLEWLHHRRNEAGPSNADDPAALSAGD